MPLSPVSSTRIHPELEPSDIDYAVERYGVAAILPSRLSLRWVNTLALGTALLLDESSHVPVLTNLQKAALHYARYLLRELAAERSPVLCTALGVELDAAEMGVQKLNDALQAEADRRSAGLATAPGLDAELLEDLKLTLPLWHDQIG